MLALTIGAPAFAADMKPGPADGFDIHVMAPHKMEDGSIAGPYHHYCKGISHEAPQCLLFELTDSNSLLTDIEYFVAKPVSRSAVSLDAWNKFYHDHDVEIATGRVQVFDLPKEKAKEVATPSAKTDGIIFHLWPKGAKAPDQLGIRHPLDIG
jgi:hypothetical protein